MRDVPPTVVEMDGFQIQKWVARAQSARSQVRASWGYKRYVAIYSLSGDRLYDMDMPESGRGMIGQLYKDIQSLICRGVLDKDDLYLVVRMRIRSLAILTEEELRKKGHDEVREAQSMTTNDYHGGDGSSGEVDHAATNPSPQNDKPSNGGDVDVDDMNAPAPGHSEQDGNEVTSSGTDHAGYAGEEPGRIGDAPGNDTLRTGGARGDSSRSDGGANHSGISEPVTDGGKSSSTAASTQAGPDVKSDATPKHNGGRDADCDLDDSPLTDRERCVHDDAHPGRPLISGGVEAHGAGKGQPAVTHIPARLRNPNGRIRPRGNKTGRVWQVQECLQSGSNPVELPLTEANYAPSFFKRAKRVMNALLLEQGNDGGRPVWDKKKLIKRLLTHRNPYLAKEYGQARPSVLVMVDTSGSCAGFSQDAWNLACAVAQSGMPGSDVWVVTCPNGMRDSDWYNPTVHNGRIIESDPRIPPLPSYGEDWSDPAQDAWAGWWSQLVTAINAQLVIVIGDDDGYGIYKRMGNMGIRMVWLDNFSCNGGEPRKSRHPLGGWGECVRHDPIPNCTYVYRCSDKDDFLAGLELALRSVSV